MKTKSVRISIMSAILTLFAAASLPSWASDRPIMKDGPVMTAKEAKALAITANTAQDHLKLARYFNQEAGRFEAEAIEHDEMIEAYRKNPAPWASKNPGSVRTIEHCQFLAKSNREMAKAFREMAANHEAMAKGEAK